MVNKRDKKTLEHNGKVYYWYVRKHNRQAVGSGSKVCIISDDKKIRLTYDLGEIKLGRDDIKAVLCKYFANNT